VARSETPDRNSRKGSASKHNFLKPHEALEGQTPADAAGIGVQGEQKWLTLLTKALTTQRGGAIE
jgi:hypothetical protein